jgi:hypothetical protein
MSILPLILKNRQPEYVRYKGPVIMGSRVVFGSQRKLKKPEVYEKEIIEKPEVREESNVYELEQKKSFLDKLEDFIDSILEFIGF